MGVCPSLVLGHRYEERNERQVEWSVKSTGDMDGGGEAAAGVLLEPKGNPEYWVLGIRERERTWGILLDPIPNVLILIHQVPRDHLFNFSLYLGFCCY